MLVQMEMRCGHLFGCAKSQCRMIAGSNQVLFPAIVRSPWTKVVMFSISGQRILATRYCRHTGLHIEIPEAFSAIDRGDQRRIGAAILVTACGNCRAKRST